MSSCGPYEGELTALLDGALSDEAHDCLLDHVEQCGACRDEYQWLTTAAADLEVIGDAVVADAPEVDLVEAVMRAVEQAQSAPRPVVSFRPRRRAARRVWAWAGAAAAAAAIVAVSWWFGWGLGPAESPEAPRFQEAEHREPAQTPRETVASPAAPAPAPTELARAEGRLAVVKPGMPRKKPGADALSLPDLASLTVRDILEARRSAAKDEAGFERLAAWATLSADQARRVAHSPGASPRAVVGASRVLSPEEATSLLEAAVEASPEDPYARLALAKALGAQPGRRDAAEAELARLSALDPENALPDYLAARNRLASGNMESALAALDAARAKQSVYMYALAAASAREEALAGSDMESDAARVLAAMTAGVDDYAELIALGDELLAQGQEYEAKGHLDIARQVYESVFRLGGQLVEGAVVSLEQLAGLDLQRESAPLLEEVYVALGAEAELQVLNDEVDQMIGPMEALITFYDAMNVLFGDLVEEGPFLAIADLILNFGDLRIFDYL